MRLVLLAVLFSTRPLDPIAAETLDYAITRSPLVRTLVDTLEHSNVIVHIQSARNLPSGTGGTTRFVVSRGGYRYLRITLAADLPQASRAAILAHELQHACEMAQSKADDVAGVTQLFASRGRWDGNNFETGAAIEIERRVRAELRTWNSRQAVSSRQAVTSRR